ncbi:O-antigen ligase family protein [Catenibacterium sp.]|uniref:O-antigen ligase family protein n=1 Tax=Catenibacterium sp. TaxID=2049022 RepID=UPI002E768E85|nr:O-antigen ligase family protein [Catenibacterium sp.]MEE0491246.1 O-antigen ligase family protein [Catenibacterium sp.]
MKLNIFQFKNISLLDVAFCIFFAIATNADLMVNPILWWGSIALIIVTQCIVNRGKLIINLNKYKLWSLSFLLISLLSLIYSINKSDSFNMLKTLVILVIIMIYVESELNNLYSIEKMIMLYVIGVGITLIYVLITQDLNQFQLAIHGEAFTGRWNGNEIGMNAAMALIMILYLFPKAKNLFLKMYYCIIVAVSLYLVYWMGSRKTIVFLILGLCGVILLKKPKKLIRNLLLVCCLITVSWNLLMEVPSLYQNVGWRLEALTSSITGKGKADSSTLLREKYIKVGIESFKESPVIGYGVASFSEINEHKTNHHTYSHNNFIEIAVGLGVIGFISFYWIFVYLIIKYLKLFIHKRTSFFVNVLFILFVLYLATQVGLVTYDSLIQWLLILFLYKAMEFTQNSYIVNK